MPLDSHWKSGRQKINADSLTADDEAFYGQELRPQIAYPLTEQLYELWMERARVAMPPHRSAFDPIDLRLWIGQLSIWDRVDDERKYVCRIYGSRLVDWVGREMTGQPVTQYPHGLGVSIQAQFDLMCTLEQPVLVKVNSPVLDEDVPKGKDTRIEKLLLPLTRSGKKVDCVLNWYVYSGADDY